MSATTTRNPAEPVAATEARLRYSAHRAVDDPAALARAARIVRAALARQVLTHDDLTPLPQHVKGRRDA